MLITLIIIAVLITTPGLRRVLMGIFKSIQMKSVLDTSAFAHLRDQVDEINKMRKHLSSLRKERDRYIANTYDLNDSNQKAREIIQRNLGEE